jgi:hypothetical protein
MKSLSTYGDAILELSEFVAKLDESVRLEAFKFLLAEEFKTGSERSAASTKAVTASYTAQSREIAPQELIRKSGATTFTEKAVVLGYWLEEFQKQPTFSSGDLKSAFEQAREQSPKNPSDLVAKLESSARVMKAEKAGSVQYYRLTSTAIQEVEGWLNTKESS